MGELEVVVQLEFVLDLGVYCKFLLFLPVVNSVPPEIFEVILDPLFSHRFEFCVGGGGWVGCCVGLASS